MSISAPETKMPKCFIVWIDGRVDGWVDGRMGGWVVILYPLRFSHF